MREVKSTDGTSSDLDAIIKFATLQSLLGIYSSVLTAALQFAQGKSWSLWLLLFTALPIIWHIAVYAVIDIYVKRRHNLSAPFVPRKAIPIYIVGVIIFLGLNFSIYASDSEMEFEAASISELPTISYQHNEGTAYFVLFGSQNCTYCYQMEAIYKEAYAQVPGTVIYYVDLSFESIDSPEFVERDISSLPVLVCYHDDKEVDRITGLATKESVITFFKNWR